MQLAGNQRLPASFAFFAQQKGGQLETNTDHRRAGRVGAFDVNHGDGPGRSRGRRVGGAIVGGAVGGPVGAAVGAAAGATAGGIADDARPRFHSYVVERRHPSYRYQSEVRVGAELPDAGVTYYEVPREYGTTQYRYTVVNDRTVLVDPGTHRIVQVVD